MSKQLILSVFLAVTSLCNAQEILEKKAYQFSDSIIGLPNTELYNGFIYSYSLRSESNDNHPYYLKNTFLQSNINYNEQTYYGVLLKYDINLDVVVINLYDKNSKPINVKLFKDKIDSFTIEKRTFVSSASLYKEHHGSIIFYEALKVSPVVSIYKRNKKKRIEYIKNDHVYDNFLDKSFYLIKYDGKLKEIKSKKDVARLFPKKKKKISEFYKQYKNLLHTNTDTFYRQLGTYLNSI